MMKMQIRSRCWINIWQCFKDIGSIITSHKCQSEYEFVDDASAAVHCLSVYIPHRAGCLKASGAHRTEIWTFSGSLNWDSPHPVLSHFFLKHNEPLWKCGIGFSFGAQELNWPLKCSLRGWEGRWNSCMVYGLPLSNRIKTYASLHNSSTSACHHLHQQHDLKELCD